MKDFTPVVSGPTGAGKSLFAEELAYQKKMEIVNADAFQMYWEIPITSNQPNTLRVNHHFLACRSIVNPSNAGEFSRESQKYFKKRAIWVGTGLYLGAALYGLDADRRKGTPFQGEPLHPFRMVVVERDRAELYEIINKRVDAMIENGAMDEIERIYVMLLEEKIKRNNPLLKTIGVNQVLSCLEGEISEKKAIELWKQFTRNLAKRQWTWLRRFCSPSNNIKWINLSKESSPLKSAKDFFDF